MALAWTFSHSGEKLPLSIRWEIKAPRGYACRLSPRFHFLKAEWYMRCGEWDGMIYLGLSCAGETLPSDSDARFSVSVLVERSRTGQIMFELSHRKDDWTPVHTCIWSRRIEDILLLIPEFLTDLRMAFRITIEEPKTDHKSVQTPLYLNPYPSLDRLSDDFAKLLEENANSCADVELHCDGHTAKAHKIVLCSRSPVLASMLQSDMLEGRTGLVNMQNLDTVIFKQFLRYLYTGKLEELTVGRAMRLYEAGDMYAVQTLTRRCSDFLIENLTMDDAHDVLAVADAHGDLDFVEAITAYILRESALQSDR